MTQACRKQTVLCVIVREDGEAYVGVNTCSIDGDTCPREEQGCASGEGYHLCGPQVHAEIAAIRQAEGSEDLEGVAFITGHDYACKECTLALRDENVHTLHFCDTAEDLWDLVEWLQNDRRYDTCESEISPDHPGRPDVASNGRDEGEASYSDDSEAFWFD